MNKLVIVGNGLDIAHGLKTKYSDFVDWKICNALPGLDNIIPYLNGTGQRFETTLDIGYVRIYINSSNILMNGEHPLKSAISKLLNAKTFFKVSETLNELGKNNSYHKIYLQYTNSIFSACIAKYLDKNWVDVEVIYYEKLKDLTRIYPGHNRDIIRLNEELDEIKKDLEIFLVNQKANINPKLNKYFNNIDKLHDFYYREEDRQSFRFQNLVLNFNYTKTPELYQNKIDINNIHGELNSIDNSIVFGYGDEYDDTYSVIEKINDNELLKNIKSIAYLNTRNYSKLLNYLDEHLFYVYIMGHSCGISDKTLLNTVFEHANCKYIRVFYHQYNDKNGNLINNYKDIASNISRVFKDKVIMRKKVVNFMDCEPLPQLS